MEYLIFLSTKLTNMTLSTLHYHCVFNAKYNLRLM